MTTTLEDLYDALGECEAAIERIEREYDRRRALKVEEIAYHIEDDLKSPLYARKIADAIMWHAEEFGRFDGNCIMGEVPSRYTKSGNPIPLCI